MTLLIHWKKVVAFITLTLLSLIGVKTTLATTTTPEATQPEALSATFNPNETLLGQSCPYGDSRSPYARVTTRQRDPLNIRSTPNGRVIGSVPSGWAVVVGRKDQTGRWTYLDYGTYYRYPSYVSAPTLRSGWVSTAFLKPLGQLCEKPGREVSMNLSALLGNETLVHEDSLQIGDRISRALPQQ